MIKKIFFQILFVFAVSGLFAQGNSDFFSTIEGKSKAGGEVKINQSDELFQATNDHIYYVRNKKGVDRYRIWIFTGNSVEMEKARSKFVREFPDYKIYPSYNAPDFYIFVGDFYRRNEAKKALKEIKKVFPNAFDRMFKGQKEEDNDYIKLIK
jgi:hypothetical protein